MARNDGWIRVRIRNVESGDSIDLYHPPRDGAAGEDVDRDLRRILGIPSPQPPGYKPRLTVEALPTPAEWLTDLVPAAGVVARP